MHGLTPVSDINNKNTMTDSSIKQSNQGIPSLSPDELETPPLSLGQLTWRRFRRHRMAIFGSVTLLLIIIYAFGGMLVFSEADANRTETGNALQPPSSEHPFGTDTIGRDILARTIYGGQISIIIGLTAMVVEVILGVSIGAIAGFFGGKIDSFLMRMTEAMLIIPQIFLLLVIARIWAQSIPNLKLMGRTFSGSVLVIVFVIGITSWPYLARIVRAQFLSVKENDYILAARATGTSTRDIIIRHILPNSSAPIIVSATLSVAAAITLEAYISFLGLGVRPPTATWGNMLEGAYNYIETAWWLWFFPGLLIALVVLSINFLGDGLRDALDPHSRAA
jgi:peptide/nickel transport system permease protein